MMRDLPSPRADRFGNARAAVRSVDGALALQYLEVTADRREGGADGVGERLDAREAVRIEMAADCVEPLDLNSPALAHAVLDCRSLRI